MISSANVPESRCLHCDKIVDAATNIKDDNGPTPGDATVCIYCGHLMIFDDALRLRNPNSEEMGALAGDANLLTVQALLAQFHATRK
jgi:hypothetical protein